MRSETHYFNHFPFPTSSKIKNKKKGTVESVIQCTDYQGRTIHDSVRSPKSDRKHYNYQLTVTCSMFPLLFHINSLHRASSNSQDLFFDSNLKQMFFCSPLQCLIPKVRKWQQSSLFYKVPDLSNEVVSISVIIELNKHTNSFFTYSTT